MNRRWRYLFQNLGILTVSNFAQKILVFLLVPLYTSVLSAAEYGMYDIAVSTVSLLYPILTINMNDAVMRFTMEKTRENQENNVPAVIGMKYAAFSIGMFGLGLFVSYWFQFLPGLNGFIIYIFLYYFSYVLNQYFIQLAKGLERVKDMGVAGVLSTAVMLGANILFLLVWKIGLPGFFMASILSQMASAVYFFFRLRFWTLKKKTPGSRKLEKQMLAYSAPLIFTTLSWWVNSTADKYAVAFLCQTGANGILAVSYKIPGVMNMLQSIFIQAWQISGISEYGKGDSNVFFRRTFLWLNIIMCMACSLLILFVRPIASLLFAGEFYVAWRYTPFLIISSMINASAGFMGPILSARKDTKTFAKSGIYGAGINVVMNVVLVFFIGIQGATVATLVSSFLIFEVRRRVAGQFLDKKTYGKILMSWGILTFQGLASVLLWPLMLQFVLMMAVGFLYLKIYWESLKVLSNTSLCNESINPDPEMLEIKNISDMQYREVRRNTNEHQNRTSESVSGGWYIEIRSRYNMAACGEKCQGNRLF